MVSDLIDVTIVISTYNQQKYLAEAIESVLKQTYIYWKLYIIQDDDSKETEEIIHKYSAGKRCIKHLKTKDIGLSATRNVGLSYTRTPFILFLDGDDKIACTFLDKTVRLLADKPEFAFIYTDTMRFGDNVGFWEQPEYNFYTLLENNYICSCSLIRTECLKACGGFDENNFNYYEDYENWINMGSKGYYGIHLAEKLFYYRVHKESGMQSERNAKLGQIYKVYIISKFPYLYPRGWKEEADKILSKYPKDFMRMKPKEQMTWLKENSI